MNRNLLSKLNQWHEDDEFEKIIAYINSIPESERDYDLTSHLARAYNNNGEYDKAIEQLFSIAEEGRTDSLWHFRLGYAYFYSGLYEQAMGAFEMCYRLDPDDDQAAAFVSMSRDALAGLDMSGGAAVQDAGPVPLSIDPETVKPFKIVSSPSSISCILPVGSYKKHIFEERRDEGFEGNGYDWTALAMVFVEETMPEMEDMIKFDPEADMFCVYSLNVWALQEFAVKFHGLCEDEARMRRLFSRAELY